MLHRHARPAVAGSHIAGAVIGALTTAMVLLVAGGLLSPLPISLRGTVAICLLALLGLHVTGVLCLDLPQNQRQIPREVFNDQPTWAAFRFAYELGTGVRTYVTAASPYAAAVLLLLTLPQQLGSAVLSAVAVGTGFGVGRSLIIAVQALRRGIAVEHPARWLRSVDVVSVAIAAGLAIQFLTQR